MDDVKNKPHKLTGNYKGFWEGHKKTRLAIYMVWLQNDNTK